jgi:hypothetical protein
LSTAKEERVARALRVTIELAERHQLDTGGARVRRVAASVIIAFAALRAFGSSRAANPSERGRGRDHASGR